MARTSFAAYEILIDDPEFTSVCPKTGLPDFGVLTIRYMPREKCLELKSLKEYLLCIATWGFFRRTLSNQVLNDVVKAYRSGVGEGEGRFSASRWDFDGGDGAVSADGRDALRALMFELIFDAPVSLTTRLVIAHAGEPNS